MSKDERARTAADYVAALTADELKAFLVGARDDIQSDEGRRETAATLSRGHGEGVTQAEEMQRKTLASLYTEETREYLAQVRRAQERGVNLPDYNQADHGIRSRLRARSRRRDGMKDTMTLAELEAEVERRRAEEQARLEREMAEREQIRDVWRQEVVAKAPALEEQLRDEEHECFATLEDAVASGDLNAAFAAYIEAQRVVRVRYEMRTAAQNAAYSLGVDPHIAADFNLMRGEFWDWVAGAQGRAVERGVDDRVRQLIGSDPTQLHDPESETV